MAPVNESQPLKLRSVTNQTPRITVERPHDIQSNDFKQTQVNKNTPGSRKDPVTHLLPLNELLTSRNYNNTTDNTMEI